MPNLRRVADEQHSLHDLVGEALARQGGVAGLTANRKV